MVQGLPLLLDFKFKRLEDALEGAQGRHLVALIIGCEPVVDLLLGVLGPGGVVELGDVVNDVLDAAQRHFLVFLADDGIKRAKNICLEGIAINLADRLLGSLLGVLRAKVLLVLGLEWLLAVADLSILGRVVLVHHELQVEGGLLAHVPREALVYLFT